MLAALGMVEKAKAKGTVGRFATPDLARADRQLSRIEAFLTRAYFQACEEGRNAISEEALEDLIAGASSGNLLKAEASTPELAWNETVSLDLRILGQPYVIVPVDVERFDAAWEERGALYVGRSDPALTEAVARTARQGLFIPPPVVADLSGSGQWAFLSGRNAYLYTRGAGHETLPLAVPRRDAMRLMDVAGTKASSGSAATGESFPVALSRPYADLNDAISYVGSLVADKFFSSVLAAALSVGEKEAVRLAVMLGHRQARKGYGSHADLCAHVDRLESILKLETALDFETPNYGALAELQRSAMNLIREFTEEQRAVVLQALRDGVTRGINPRDMARTFRASIGLTRTQEQWVENYRNALSRAHLDATAQANAMGRALHDNRFNASVRGALARGVPLTPEKIDKMVDIYRGRFIAYRAETIARTQALRAVHMGERAVWEEAVRRGDIQQNEVEETWNTAHDERVRASHRLMDRQKRRMGVPFTSGAGNALRFPGDPLAPPADSIQCRCMITRQLTAEPGVEVINEGEAPTPAAVDPDEDADLSLLVQPKTPKGYRSLAGRLKPAEAVDDLFDQLPYGYGQDPLSVSRGISGRGALKDQLGTEELRKLVSFYQQQAQTKLDRSLTAYLDVLKSQLPKGPAAKLVGKTLEIPFSSPLTLNARLAASEGSTILQVKLKKGTVTAFVGADRQGLSLPPGARAVIKSVRKLTPAEYLAETGAAVRGKNLPTMLNPKGGYTVIEVEIVDNMGRLPAYLDAMASELSTRSVALKEINDLIARNNATQVMAENAPTVTLAPKKGSAAWNAYMKGSFDGANDVGRAAINRLKPIKIVSGEKGGPYFDPGKLGLAERKINVLDTAPKGAKDFGIFRHELGHYVDTAYHGVGLPGSSPYYSAKLADEVETTYQRWRAVAGAADDAAGTSFQTLDDVTDYLAGEFGVSAADLRANSSVVTDFLRSQVTKFEAENAGFKLADLFPLMDDRPDELLKALQFARAVDAGDMAGLTKVIGPQHGWLSPAEWSARDELAHGLYDLVGSVSRLHWGGGHSGEYYLKGKWLLENLPGGRASGGMTILSDDNTGEAFANWFNLYTKGPGERAIMRKMLGPLNTAFENYLQSVGGGSWLRFW